MLSPDEEFYNGIEVIYEQCENDGYSILEIVSLSGESLYLYPVRSINPKNLKVVFFANRIQAQWFKKLKKNLIKDHLSIEDFLRKYDNKVAYNKNEKKSSKVDANASYYLQP